MVLEETVGYTADGRALGLVRNETTDWYGDVEVTAVVSNGDAARSTQVEATVLVQPLRPGEPVPFAVELPATPSTDATVTWQATGVPVAASAVRMFEVLIHWQVPAGERELYASDVVGYREEERGQLPGLLVGSVNNLADEPVPIPEVVVGWVDASGRLLSVGFAQAATGRHGAVRMLPTDYVEFVATVPDESSTPADPATAMIWVSGGGR